MPKRIVVADDLPESLRSFTFHGVDIEGGSGSSKNFQGDCPFCGSSKFYVNAEVSLCDCKVCGFKGNVYTFLQEIWKTSMEGRAEDRYATLLLDRGLLSGYTFIDWGLTPSFLTDRWLTPGYNVEGSICQLYAWTPIKDKGTGEWRKRNLPTPGLDAERERHGILGLPLYDESKPNVFVLEGVWDGMAWWESLPDDIRESSSVLAVPGCNVFNHSWGKLFSAKQVFLMFHSDHPKTNVKNKNVSPPGGFEGMKRVAGILTSSDIPPLDISYLYWGDKGYAEEKPSGYDLRDWLRESGDSLEERQEQVREILGNHLRLIPFDWVKAKGSSTTGGGNKQEIQSLPCIKCESWDELVEGWEKAIKLIPGLRKALAVMLSVVTSTLAVGDQLWVRVIGPPSSGKTVLCEALSINKKYINPKDTFTSLFSGMKSDKEGSVDFSEFARWRDKTTVIKDGDTVLRTPDRPRLLSQFRAAYDRAVRTSYGNGASRNYEGYNSTVIICGTKALHELDSSDLGERLLTVVVVEGMEEELRREIGLKVAHDAEREMSFEYNGTATSRDTPEMRNAKQLTGGYINYLRENAQVLIGTTPMEHKYIEECYILAEFITLLRSRPSIHQEEGVDRELPFRVTKQLVRLAKCLTVVMNHKTVDNDVMRLVREVTLDSSSGRTLQIVKALMTCGNRGATTGVIAQYTGETEHKERALLKHLMDVGALGLHIMRSKKTGRQETHWKLTPYFGGICKRVLGVGIGELEEGEDNA